MDFNQPIPGQSLTVEPKKYPYERPPEITDPEAAIRMHLGRLQDPDVKQTIVDMVEVDPDQMDVKTITNFILRSAVSSGLHSIDLSMIVAPVLHQQVKNILDDNGVDYEEGIEDFKKIAKDRQKIERAKNRTKTEKLLASSKNYTPEEEPMEEEASPAFFSRRGKQ